MSIADRRREALELMRSGELAQGQRLLRTKNDGYCCLGVLCESFRRQTGQGRWELHDRGYEFITKDGYCSTTTLPSAVADFFDTNQNPWLPYRMGPVIDKLTAASLNDELGLSLNKIADRFEQEWAFR